VVVEINIVRSRQMDFSNNPPTCVNLDNNNLEVKCERNGTRLILKSPCSSLCSNNRIGVRIFGLRNTPYSVENITSRPEDSFIITAYTSDNFTISMINQSVYAYPLTNTSNLTVYSFSRSNNIVSSHINLNVSLTISSELYSDNNFLRLTFPPKVFYFSNEQSLTCHDESLNKLGCSGTTEENYVKTILVSRPCLPTICSKGSNFSLNISGIRNFYYAYNSLEDILVHTVANDYKGTLELIDKGSVTIPGTLNNLVPNALKWMTAVAENPNTNANTTIYFGFSTTSPIIKGSTIYVLFPGKINTTSEPITCKGLVTMNKDLYCRIMDDNSIEVTNAFLKDSDASFVKFSFSIFRNPNVSINIANINGEMRYYGMSIDRTSEGIVLIFLIFFLAVNLGQGFLMIYYKILFKKLFIYLLFQKGHSLSKEL
jgi:hypothetical protein